MFSIFTGIVAFFGAIVLFAICQAVPEAIPWIVGFFVIEAIVIGWMFKKAMR